MKTYLLVLVIAFVAAGASLADSENPMLPEAGPSAHDDSLFTIELYPQTSAGGNQAWVRKYEGQNNTVFSLGTVNMLGYDNAWQYFINGADVFSGNTLLTTEFGCKDNLWIQAGTDSITRRLPIFPFSNHNRANDPLWPVVIAPEFRVDRTANGAVIQLTPWSNRGIALYGIALEHNESGNRPLPLRSRAGAATVNGVTYPNGTKFETTEPIKQQTNEVGGGTSVRIGVSTVSYTATTSRYTNNAPGVLLPGFNANEYMRNSRFDDTTTSNHIVKASVPIGSALALTGSWTNRNRTHDTNGIVVPQSGPQTIAGNVSSNLTTSVVNLRYLALPDLQFNANYRHFNNDRNSPAILTGTPAALQNASVSERQSEGGLSTTYTGLRKTLLNAGYCSQQVDRDIIGPEAASLSPQTATNTATVKLRTYIIPKVTLSGDFKSANISQPSFHGTPSQVYNTKAALTYTPKDDLSFYADACRLHEKNATIAAPTFLTVAAAGSNAAFTADREESAGAQFDNTSDTVVLGMYKSIANKLTADLNYMYDKANSRAYWIFGTTPGLGSNIGAQGDPTGLPPELVPFNVKENMYGAGLTYAQTCKLTWRTNLFMGKTSGAINTASLFRLVPPVGDKPTAWNRVDVNYYKYSIGLAYRWTQAQQFFLNYEHDSYNDKVENIFGGRYNLATIGVVTSF